MRMRGFEPPRPKGHRHLKPARLPVPPHPQARGGTIAIFGPASRAFLDELLTIGSSKTTKPANSNELIIDFQTGGGYDTGLVMKTIELGCFDAR